MQIEVTQIDIDDAVRKSAAVKTYLHVRYNPLACALERQFGEGNVVITESRVHISSPILSGVYDLAEPAKTYLKIYRSTTRARPLNSIEIFRDHWR